MKFLCVGFITLAYLVSQAQLAIAQNELLHLTRYAGMGYNVLQANPEGDFISGGINPGIKTTKYIFKHTFNEEKQITYRGQTLSVPDQVNIEMRETCATTNTYNAYSGQTSYQRELLSTDQISGMVAADFQDLSSLQFSLSSGMSNYYVD